MIGDDAQSEFARTNMAWLTSEGELLVCALHGHMGRLETVPAFAESYGRYKDICDGNEDVIWSPYVPGRSAPSWPNRPVYDSKSNL